MLISLITTTSATGLFGSSVRASGAKGQAKPAPDPDEVLRSLEGLSFDEKKTIGKRKRAKHNTSSGVKKTSRTAKSQVRSERKVGKNARRNARNRAANVAAREAEENVIAKSEQDEDQRVGTEKHNLGSDNVVVEVEEPHYGSYNFSAMAASLPSFPEG